MEMIKVSGGHLAAFAEGQGTPVIFLHGGPGDTHHYMKRMAEPLFRDFRCLFFDQRGTGGSEISPRRDEQFSMNLLFEDIAAIQEHFKTGPCALVGHSWGAMYALYAAMHFPERFTRITMCNIGPLDAEAAKKTYDNIQASLSQEELKMWTELRAERNAALECGDIKTIRRADKELIALRLKSWIFNPALRDSFLEEYLSDPPPDREVNKWICASADRWFSWARIGGANVPAWLCVGANDSVPISHIHKISTEMPHCRLTILERCGHIPWLEHPEAFYGELKAFLKGN